MRGSAEPHGPRWWHGATLYQIYVRSWCDADGDGYGDLRGVISRLDHLTWLGVDGVWLSPIMPSPDQDWGYDVCDYLGVHPELGTMADLDLLVERAGARGLKVLLDLVPNHTSTAHPWFVDAVSGPGSSHRRFYIWADPAPGGGPPNNWQDATGRAAWEFDSGSGQYYLHTFLRSQADLNWREPAVHESFLRILRFWFDRGIAGFRIDVAHGLYKDSQLRDDPPQPGGHGGPRPGGSALQHRFSANRPETHGVYRQWRAIAESYPSPRLLLGETWVADLKAMAGYHGDGDELQLTFNFPFIFAPFTAQALSAVVAQTLAHLPAGECAVWTGSNHDVSRFPTRWCGGDERKVRLALLVLATLPGTLVLYYGDELAMTDVAVPARLRRDPMTPDGLAGEGRDRARTPMRWNDESSAGFTAAGVAPWLPYGEPAQPSVASQRDDPASTLRFCRDLLALRRAEFGGTIAGYRQLPGPPELWAYQVGRVMVAANFSPAPLELSGASGPVLLATSPGGAPATSPAVGTAAGRVLGPWQGAVMWVADRTW